MKIIFLDFDGVLNSRRFFASAAPIADADEALDPAAVARLNRVIAATSAQVVISSSWRTTVPMDRILAILAAHGFDGTVVGATPVVSGSRGRQIRAWLEQARGVTSFVILDDARDMDGLDARQVRTLPDEGLLDAHVEAACRVLARRRFWRW